MQRPFAARRHEAGAVDRRIAVVSFSIAAVVLFGSVAFAHAPLPAIAVRDPAAARDLVALMRAGERGDWIASYDFTRTLANGGVRRSSVREGRSGTLHVIITGPSMTIEDGDRSSECSRADGRAGCAPPTVGRTLPDSEVLRVAVASGAYNVVRRPDATIAGIRARCFRVRATGRGGLPGLGVETEQCFAPDGLALSESVARPPGTVDEQRATSVRTPATRDDVEALARSFTPNGGG